MTHVEIDMNIEPDIMMYRTCPIKFSDIIKNNDRAERVRYVTYGCALYDYILPSEFFSINFFFVDDKVEVYMNRNKRAKLKNVKKVFSIYDKISVLEKYVPIDVLLNFASCFEWKILLVSRIRVEIFLSAFLKKILPPWHID